MDVWKEQSAFWHFYNFPTIFHYNILIFLLSSISIQFQVTYLCPLEIYLLWIISNWLFCYRITFLNHFFKFFLNNIYLTFFITFCKVAGEYGEPSGEIGCEIIGEKL